jgi:hypothetical protein
VRGVGEEEGNGGYKKRHIINDEAWGGELVKGRAMDDIKRDTLLKLSTKVFFKKFEDFK